METALDRAFVAAGGLTGLARALGQSKGTVNHWKTRVPAEWCPRIEKATGVPCEELRPDLHWLRIDADGWPGGKPVLDLAPA